MVLIISRILSVLRVWHMIWGRLLPGRGFAVSGDGKKLRPGSGSLLDNFAFLDLCLGSSVSLQSGHHLPENSFIDNFLFKP